MKQTMSGLLLLLLLAGAARADLVHDAAQAYAQGELARVRELTDAYLQQPLSKPAARVALAAYYRGLAATTVAEREHFLLQASAGNALDSETRAAALVQLMKLALLRGDHARAALWGERVLNDFAGTTATADAAYYAALAYLRNGNGERALTLLADLGRRQPPPPGLDRAEAAIAAAQQREQRYAEAIQTLQQMLIGYPESAYKSWIYFQLGENYRLLGDRAQAAVAYQQVVEQYPGSYEAAAARLALSETGGMGMGTNPPEVTPAIRTPPPVVSTPTGAWTVQVAALTSPAEAEALAQQLRARGYALIDIQRAQVRGTWYYRVRVGNYASKAMAGDYQAALRQQGYGSAFVAAW
ncbi:MAG TPA: SPOR domain-containing protein [bacterium]|nr:SPOR domain-containing protein [bacterium]